MSWAKPHIEKLTRGETVTFRPRGRSMEPRVGNGWLCRVEPVERLSDLRHGDVVLCSVKGVKYLHLVTGVRADGAVQISNNKGRINGWTHTVYGRLVEASP